MKNNLAVKIIIAVFAVIAVGVAAFFIADHVVNGEEPTTLSSELVSPEVTVPVGTIQENAPDTTAEWNEDVTLLQSVVVATTAPQMPEEAPGEVETLAEPSVLDAGNLKSDDKVTLVLNANYKLPLDYLPYLEEIAESDLYMEAKAAAAFNKMYKDALAQGLTLTPAVAYVSVARQQIQFDNLTEKYERMGYSEAEAQALAARKVLPAGCSEHNAGLAVDFASEEADFTESVQYKWLVRNAAYYGFIERYTEEFEDETGVDANASHWRFVGSSAMAKAIVESGMSFEGWMESEFTDWEAPEEESTTRFFMAESTEGATEEATNDETAESAGEEQATDEQADEPTAEESATVQENTDVVIDLDL
ncbi:MAG: M15 family metallopeptidase [Clostridia bacterium]|nr:M15 family metallopeptidase [Clostridia bacterium]